MLSMTSALREMASARRWLAMAETLAFFSRFEVVISLARVRPNRMKAPARAMRPMTQCSAKMTAM